MLEDGFGTSQSTQAGAVTDEWVETYQGMASGPLLDDAQVRLQALGPRQSGYFGAKAQCWIDAAREERMRGNGWGFVEEAAHQADLLIGGLEGHGQLLADNPKLRTSALVRPDLWRQLLAAKSSSGWAACPQAQQVVACAEVELIHAGHEAWLRSFDASSLRVARIEQEAQILPGMLKSCEPPPPPPPPPIPQKLTLPTDMLFEFDRSDVEGMLPEGRERLDELVRNLGAAREVTAIRADGYTDRLGSEAYNLGLSQRRARTVVDYLRNQGAMPSMSWYGHGKDNPVVQCSERDRVALIACLAPNRRVDLTFSRSLVSAPQLAPRE